MQLFHNTETEKGDQGQFKIRLHFNHATCALFFTLHLDDSVDSMFSPLDELISFRFIISGHIRCEGNRHIAGTLNKIDHKILLGNNVYVIPFGLEPFNTTQPSGSLNMSRIDHATLEITTTKRIKIARVWGNYWNVLRVMNGMGALAYAI